MLMPTTQARANAVARVEKMTSGYTINGQGRRNNSNKDRSFGNGDQSFNCWAQGFLGMVERAVVSEVSEGRWMGCWAGLGTSFSRVFVSLAVLEDVSGLTCPWPVRSNLVSGQRKTTTRKFMATRMAAIILCQRCQMSVKASRSSSQSSYVPSLSLGRQIHK